MQSENIHNNDALIKIKKAKELLDMGAIDQKEFDNIKKKYLNQILEPNKGTKKNKKSKKRVKKAPSQKKSSNSHEDKAKFNQNTNEMDYYLKDCPNCGKKIPVNEVMCSDCKFKLMDYFKSNSSSLNFDLENDNFPRVVEEKHGMKICPYCYRKIPSNAVSCRYCRGILKKYPQKNKTKKSETQGDKPVLSANIRKVIEENTEDVCRIFSIPNLGKKFVINKLLSEYTEKEISDKLKLYIDVSSSNKPSPSKRVIYKTGLINDKLNEIPDNHFELLFIINDMSFNSKAEFINHVKVYWGAEKINDFYNDYKSLLMQGIQEKDFEKILYHDIGESCKIFSIADSKRMLGDKFIVNNILRSHDEEEIKEKLNAQFDLFPIADDSSNVATTENKEVSSDAKTESNSTPKQKFYFSYKDQINDLKSQFEVKKQNACELIEKSFPGPQMTNSKFNDNVENCSKIFYHKVDSTMVIIDSATEYSIRLEDEIKSNINVLNEVIDKIDLLHDELLIKISESDEDNVENLLEEMDMLIDSVKDY